LRHALQWRSSFFLIAMAYSDTIDQIAERVDHLLLRHEELQRTNALLTQQVQALSLERDQLKSRLAAARARVDALIERLPTSAAAPASPEASA
jgi:cell division protein ZapB